MSSATASPTSSPSPTDTSSSDNDITGAAQYYNYFFLLLAVAFLILFLLLLYFQRRRKVKNARLQQHGRVALVQDVSRFSPAVGLWHWRAAREPAPRPLARVRSTSNDSIIEAGFDERGEAPPPYNTATTDKASPIPTTESIHPPGAEALPMCHVSAGERMVYRLPPGYSENDASEEGSDSPARPGAVVTVAERLAEVDLEAQPRRDIHQSRFPPGSATRWSSMRRLMSSTEGSA